MTDRAALMALLDGAMADAAAARSGGAREAVTIELQVSFMKAAAGPLTASARATGGGRSICFCEAEATDHGGQVVARALGTFRYREG